MRKGLRTCIVSSAPTFSDPRTLSERVLFSDRTRGPIKPTRHRFYTPDDFPRGAACGDSPLSIDHTIFLSAIHFPSIPLYYAVGGPLCLMFFRCYPPLAVPVPLLYQNAVCVLNHGQRMNSTDLFLNRVSSPYRAIIWTSYIGIIAYKNTRCCSPTPVTRDRMIHHRAYVILMALSR